MKARKILSAILTLTLLTSVFASLSIVNVSAHQNFGGTGVTFDETNADGTLKYATGNLTTTGTYKYIEQYQNGGKFTAFHNDKYYFNDVAEAPDNRYGKSLLIREYYEDGATTEYVQSMLTPSRTLNSTIRLTASLYTKKNANNSYIQRAIQLKPTTGNRKYAVLFAHDSTKITVFGKDTGKTYKPDVWYDIDITYNIENGQFHAVIAEDGVEYIDFTGTDTSAKMVNVETMILYHSGANANSNDIWIYWDNVSIKSADKLYTTSDNSKTVLDFNDFDTAGKNSMPSGMNGVWTYSYNGGGANSATIPIVKSIDAGKEGKGISYFAPIQPSTDAAYKNHYYYPQIRFTHNTKLPARYQISFSLNLKSSQVFMLFNSGNKDWHIIYTYGNSFKMMGNTIPTATLKLGDYRSAWFDFDVKIDGVTGYYTASLVKSDDPTVKAEVSGYDDNLKTFYSSNKKEFIFQQNSSLTAYHEVLFDDVYFGELNDWEEPAIAIDDITATATAEAEGTATAQLPFAAMNLGHFISADLTVTGAASALNLGSTVIDISSLEEGTYPVAIQVLNGTTPTATVKIGETDYPATLTAVPTSIGVVAPTGEGNVASLTAVNYDIIRNFEITSEQSFKNAELEDDVTITFTNPLADSVTAENFVVYKPAGTLSDAAKVADAVTTIAADRKSVTISFAKENAKHYHIAINGVTDEFGFALNDYVEINTTALPYVGDVTVDVKGDTATATFISHKTAAEVFFAIGLFNGNELVSVVPADVTLSANDVEREFKVAITAPADGVNYAVKAFRWNAANQAPYEGSKVADATICVPLAE